nr:hypothetical protein [Tanacetum cinerariifolium]
MIPEPGDANREVIVTETFHVQTDDELTDKELKQIEADDQAIQTILLGLPKISMLLLIAVKLLRKSTERLAKTQDPLALMANSNNHYAFPAPHQDQSSFNQNYLQQPMTNLEDITDPTTAMNMALALMAKAFKLNYSSPTNNNQRISSNPRNRQITQLGMNMGQDRQMQMVGGNGRNQFRQVQNVGNQNGLIGVQGNGNQNQIGNGNLVAARAEGITARRKRQESNFKQKSNLQQASTSGTQTDKAPVYDSNGSAEEAAKFVADFKSLANEADTSLAKHKALELKIKRLLKVVVSQDIMTIVQKESVVDTSDLQTE